MVYKGLALQDYKPQFCHVETEPDYLSSQGGSISCADGGRILQEVVFDFK